MTGWFILYCPYCGKPNTDEYDLLNLHKDVYFLECRECHKESTLVLYDISAETVKTEDK